MIPEWETLNVPIHVLNGSGRLTPYLDRIARIASGSINQCCASLTLDQVTLDLVVRDAPGRTIPEVGIGGFNPDPNTVIVSLDPTHKALDAHLDRELGRAIAHELHHLARRRGPGYGRTLLEALISEGLADQFSIEATNAAPPPWTFSLTEAELATVKVRAERLYESADYDHRAWFFGAGADGLPRWSGYSLGFRLVRDYLNHHTESSASALVHAPASTFIF